jgi:hypothetical protein
MDLYRIGVTISMVNNASAVLGVIQRDVLKLQQSVDMLTGGFTAAKAAVAGLGAALGGDAALGAMGKLVGQGKELARQQGLFAEKLRHMPAMIPGLPTGRSTNSARQALTATSSSEDFKDTHELTTASGKATGVQSNMPFNIRARPLMGSMLGGGDQDQSFGLTKTATALGSPQKTSPATLRDATARTSSFIDPILSALAQRMNASRGNASIAEAGNPLQPAVRDLMGGVTSGVRQGDRAGAAEPQANAHPSGDHVAQQIGVMFATQRAQFETDSSLNRGASGMSSLGAPGQNDPTANIKTFQETWNSLLTTLGAPLVDTASNLMASLTHAMNDFSQWAVAHPELIEAIEKTVGALATLAASAGLFAIGAKAATALGLLTGPAGLIGLAAGIETLGKALPSLPSWLEHLATGSAAGVAISSVAPIVGTRTAATNGPGLGPLSSGTPSEIGARMPVGPPSASSAGPIGPLPVYVVNGRDIADGTTAHQAALMSAPPNGPTGGDPRMSLPMPAFGAIVGL